MTRTKRTLTRMLTEHGAQTADFAGLDDRPTVVEHFTFLKIIVDHGLNNARLHYCDDVALLESLAELGFHAAILATPRGPLF